MPHLRSLWPKSERCAGSSILELVMVLALLLVVLGGALTLVFHSQIGFAQQMEQFAIEQSGRHIVERLTNEFQQASPASIQPLVMQNSKYATYQRVVGYSGGAVQLGPQITMIFEPAEGESQNGSDDNGDGRVDEGYVSYREANQAPVRLVGDVVGLRFTSTATGISFSVDIGRVDRDGRLMQRTFTQVATFRN